MKCNHFYVHIPFCRRKCCYCGFYSVVPRGGVVEKFCKALKDEIFLLSLAEDIESDCPATIFFGGGTPSILEAQQIGDIVNNIRTLLNVNEFLEITVEANPESISQEKLIALLDYNVNRISIGIQSLSDERLHFLGRIHNSEQAIEAIRNAKSVGFDNINCDLIFGIPGQSANDFVAELMQLIDMGVKHISLYALSLEKNTPLYNDVSTGKIEVPNDDAKAEIYYSAEEFLGKSGFCAYEVSNFAISGYECAHNIAYWTGENYLGFGPSAHSFSGECRWSNLNSVGEYMRTLSYGALPKINYERLTQYEKFVETVMLGLRLKDGFSLSEAASFLEKLDDSQIVAAVRELIDEDIVKISGDRLYIAAGNRLLADGIATKIIGAIDDGISKLPETRACADRIERN